MAVLHRDIARKWIGTPYCHQMSVLAVGCDCLGLVRAVWRETVGEEPVALPKYTPDWDEYSKSEVLWQTALDHMVWRSLDIARIGDVALFRMRKSAVAKHVGILSERSGIPTLIHAISGRSVCETTLSQAMQARMVAQFSFPERAA